MADVKLTSAIGRIYATTQTRGRKGHDEGERAPRAQRAGIQHVPTQQRLAGGRLMIPSVLTRRLRPLGGLSHGIGFFSKKCALVTGKTGTLGMMGS